ncbi:hypothetical protein [Antrihabitans cavernicola]|uniref:Uncharacterized protein n=1 Tax=Antrihabitans cavernicola TaxID=2495913 RepID=A0A5A7S8B6_9NOCA|nr:hypothetical protein [Spelaeibacter cavernicola]KAA0021724.1 hypothetical protein FOY51_17730 [Spelaeibacter cavernicola]
MTYQRTAAKAVMALAITIPLTTLAAPIANADTGSGTGSATGSASGSAATANTLLCQFSWGLFRLLNPTAPTPTSCPQIGS